MLVDPSETGRSLSQRFVYALMWATTGTAITTAAWFLAQKFSLLQRAPARLLVLIAATSLLGSVLWALVPGILEDLLLPPPASPTPTTAEDVVSTLVFCSILLLTWQSAAVAVHQVRAARLERERALRAEDLARQAKLQTLRSQLSPHFLFNSLNSVVALIGERPDDAQRMLTDISTLLRRTLQPEDTSLVLRDELELVDMLVQIQQARFEDSLNVEMDIDPASLDHPFPALLLQPLVENAIKHGMNTGEPPVSVRLTARSTPHSLQLHVVNTGSLQAKPLLGVDDAGAGVGLANVRARLRELFPGRHYFRLYEDDGWVHAELELNTVSEGGA